MESNDGSRDLEKFKERLGDVDDELIADRKALNDLTKSWDEFDAKNDEVKKAIDRADLAKKEAKEVGTTSGSLVEDVEELSQQVKNIQAVTAPEIRNMTENMTKSREAVNAAVKRLADVKDAAEKNDENLESLANSLVLLKEKIQEARDKASRIKVSVKSDSKGLCQRRYDLDIDPTPVNSINLKYRPLHGVPDSLIFLIRTQQRRTQKSEFLALELVDQRFVFHWNIGTEDDENGDSRITNYNKTVVYDPTGKSWYQVDIVRKGNRASLAVSVLEVKSQGLVVVQEPIVIENGVESDYRIFNVRPETKISLGCSEEDKPKNARTNLFRGTVGELNIEGRRVPLWDFVSSSGGCEGASKVDKPIAGPGIGGYMFRDGYAQVRAEGQYTYQSFSIQIMFASYSARGLLYFRGDQNNGDFVSIELVDGRIVLQFNLGGVSNVRLESKKSYNDGKTHVVFATREKRNGTLQVDSDDIVNEEAEGKNEGLNVKTADHFVGGVPESYNRSKFQRFDIAWKGFYGCIQSIQPVNGLSLDLSTATKSLNYEQGCQTKSDGRLLTSDRKIGFLEKKDDSVGGFFVIPGIKLSHISSFAFGFKTRQENATLIYQSSKVTTYRRRVRQAAKGQGFLSAYLYKGTLSMNLGTDAKGKRGHQVLSLRTISTFNDGLTHSVFLERERENVRLLLDDSEVGSGTLTDRKTIGAEGAQLFIGGMKSSTKPLVEEFPTSVVPLHGCISDLYSDFERVALVPEEHANTIIGSCPEDAAIGGVKEKSLQADSGSWAQLKTSKLSFAEEKPEPFARVVILDKVTEAEVLKCGPELEWSSFQTAAIEYGAFEESFSEVNLLDLGRKRTRPINFTISLTFRTNQANGMLFFWANRKFKQFMNMSVVDGKVVYRIKGHKPDRTLNSVVPVNDGQWHTVRLIKWSRLVSMSVDSEEPVANNRCPNKIRILRKRFFVGGFPDYVKRRKRLNETNLLGCIKDFTFNERPIPLFKYGRNVKVCKDRPAEAEQVFVKRDGFLTFETNKLEPVIFELDFRSSNSDSTLLSFTTDPMGFTHLSASLSGGKVTAVAKFQNETVAEALFEGSYCDGQWHRLRVEMNDVSLVASVDGFSRTSLLAEPAVVEKFKQASFLHIGGVPKEVRNVIPGLGRGLNGCIRNVRLSSKTVSFSSVVRQFGIISGICPFERN